MNIIIEGPDGSGKSTLARYLSQALNMPIHRGEGPIKSETIYRDRMKRYLAIDTPTIFDRHFLVSEFIYGQVRSTKISHVKQSDADAFYACPANFFIYCNGRLPHIADHAGDTPSHLAMISEHGELIRDLYDEWAQFHADLYYRNPAHMSRTLRLLKGLMLTRSFDPVADVEEFHVKMGIQYEGKPRVLPFEAAQFRLKFMREETTEYENHQDQALFESSVERRAVDQVGLTYHLGQSLDALADLVYVALGTSHLHGFNFREAWKRVHTANMLKVPEVIPSNSESRFKLKITKPPGWEAPKHDDLVEDNAHRV